MESSSCLVKIKWIGIGRKAEKLLFEIKFFLKIGNFQSRNCESTSGVLVGSILGPTLLLFRVNDIDDFINHVLVLLMTSI